MTPSTKPTMTDEEIYLRWAKTRSSDDKLARLLLALAVERDALRAELARQLIATEERANCAEAARDKLVEALGWFLEDTRFKIAVGGNPIAVDKMLIDAHAALKNARSEP